MTSPCGCSDAAHSAGECFCSLVSSDTITVQGSGTATSPYSMHLTVPPTTVAERDTDTVDMHVTELSPGQYEVAADVILSQDSGNVLIQGSDGGLYVQDGTAAPTPAVEHKYQTESQLLPDGVPTPLMFDVADPGEPGTIHTIPVTGVYQVSAFVATQEFLANYDAFLLYISLGTSPSYRLSGAGCKHLSDMLGFQAGDQFQVVALNRTGGDMHTATGLNGATRLSLVKVTDIP